MGNAINENDCDVVFLLLVAAQSLERFYSISMQSYHNLQFEVRSLSQFRC